MPTQNKEVLRIRALPKNTAHFIHLSAHPTSQEVLKKYPHLLMTKIGGIYACPPKNFKRLRAERKVRWAALEMKSGRKSDIHGYGLQ